MQLTCSGIGSKFAKLVKAVLTTYNKLIRNDVNVKLIHFLSVDVEQHYMIQPALAH